VCEALGLKKTTSNNSYQVHYRRLDADQLRLAIIPATNARSIRMKLVSEGGMCELTVRSDKPEACAFQDWVTHTILPVIEKDGGYIMGEEKVVTGEMDEAQIPLVSVGGKPPPRCSSSPLRTISSYAVLMRFLTQ
jgi:prophage antirepressor-like protein